MEDKIILNLGDLVNKDHKSMAIVKSVRKPCVYRIYDIHDEKLCYIGSTKGLYGRLYGTNLFGYCNVIINSSFKEGHKLFSKISVNPQNYNIEVLELCDTLEEARKRETELVKEYNSYNEGYNSTPTGHPFSGKIPNRSGLHMWVTNGEDSEYIRKDELDEYLSKGYHPGNKITSDLFKDSVSMHDDNITIRVSKDDVEYYLKKGYVLGRGYDDPKLGRIVMTNGVETKFIKPQEYDDYVAKGFSEGKDEVTKSRMRNKICMTNGEKDIRVTPDEIELYESKGYWKGRKPGERSNLRYITNLSTGEVKRVNLNVLDEYLKDGN